MKYYCLYSLKGLIYFKKNGDHHTKDPNYYWALRLNEVMDGIGTDEKSLSRIAVLHSDDMVNIRLRYKALYGNTLRSTIEVSVSIEKLV